MITLENIKKEWGSNFESYFSSEAIEGQKFLCDVYLKSKRKDLKQEQLDTLNHFINNNKNYLSEIGNYINSNLNFLEMGNYDTIKNLPVDIEILEVPYDGTKYDLVLICSKNYKVFYFIKRSVGIRVEFKNGIIQSMERKNDLTEDNME